MFFRTFKALCDMTPLSSLPRFLPPQPPFRCVGCFDSWKMPGKPLLVILSVWKTLPPHNHMAHSLTSFRSIFKDHLLSKAFPGHRI